MSRYTLLTCPSSKKFAHVMLYAAQEELPRALESAGLVAKGADAVVYMRTRINERISLDWDKTRGKIALLR